MAGGSYSNGSLKNKVIIGLAKWFEKKVYKKAQHIIALSPGMYDGVLATGIAAEKITMIPNMSKIDEFWPRKKNVKLIEKLGLGQNSFKVVYFGAMGASNEMTLTLNAARALKDT